MTPGRRRLVALAAVLAPRRATAILARLGGDQATEALALAASLAEAPRRARLAALAGALAAEGTPSRGGDAAPARVARAHPLLARLLLEAESRAGEGDCSCAPRTEAGGAGQDRGGRDRPAERTLVRAADRAGGPLDRKPR